MKIDKLQSLKEYSNKALHNKLFALVSSLPDDFLSETLYTKNILKSKIQKISHCHDKILKAGTNMINIDTGEVKSKTDLILGKFCNQYLICPVCAKKRTQIIYNKYIDKIKEQFYKHKYSYLITFTVKNQDTFNKTWNILTNGLRKFRLFGRRRGGLYSYGESAKIKSAIGCGEIKRGNGSGKNHSHFHFLAFTDDRLDYEIYYPEKYKEIYNYYNENYLCKPDKAALKPAVKEWYTFRDSKIPVSKLSKEWIAATDGTSCNIDVQPINNKKYDIEKTVREVIKYTSKIADLSASEILELIVYKDKKRFFTTWGELRGLDDNDDIVNDNPQDVTEENLKYDYLIESTVYDMETGKYSIYDEKENTFIKELIDKKENIKQFISYCNYTRTRKNELLNEVRETINRETILNGGLKIPEFKKDMIRTVESLNRAYNMYVEKLFRKIVDIKRLRDKRKIFNKMYGLEKHYYNIFYKQGFFTEVNTT